MNITEIQEQLELQPVVASIYVNEKGAQIYDYKGGVFTATDCDSIEVGLTNHEVLLVGYGLENGVPFWLIKNQWTTNWGENGYGKILAGSNFCNIESKIYYPII